MMIIKNYIMTKKRKTTAKNRFTYKNDYSDLLELFKRLDKNKK